jgi:ABC-type multidrug transport system fused ATPase/permease subunit
MTLVGDEVGRQSRRGESRLRAALRLVGQHRLRVTLLTASAVVGGLIEAVFLVAVTKVGFAISAGDSDVEFGGWGLSTNGALAGVSGLLVVRLAVLLAGMRVSAGLAYRISTGLRRRLAHAFFDTSWAMQQRQPAGTLQQLVVQYPAQAIGLMGAITNSIAAGCTLATMLVVALFVDVWSTLIVIGALVVLSALLGPMRRIIHRRADSAVQNEMAFASSVAEMSQLGLEVHAFGVRQPVRDRIDELVDRDATAQRSVSLASGAVSPIYVTFAYFTIVLALAAVAAFGEGRLDSVGAVMLVMLRSLGYGQQLQGNAVAMAAVQPFLTQIDTTEAAYRAHAATDGATPIDQVGEVEFSDVSFAYEAERPVLRDLTMSIAQGESIGVIGPSGGGKSTFVQLLLGLRNPVSGAIRVGGVDLREVHRGSWTQRVAFVPQTATLITATVADNVAFFRPSITRADVERAVDHAQLRADIEALPNGLDTMIGDHALQLSGGQRQRLAIARALAGSPQLLVLDEPTSALDPRSEVAIRSTLEALHGSTTVVVVAHRLSTVEKCDRIMVIDDGGLAAMAPPVELATTSAYYAEALRVGTLDQ